MSEKLIHDMIYEPQYDESFEDVKKHLIGLSQRLYELLPDITLSPDERLERIARIIPTSILISDNYKTGRVKLRRLRNRLDELVPNNEMDYYEKLEYLVNRVNELVPEDILFFKKLEKIGDKRKSDIGRNWAPPKGGS